MTGTIAVLVRGDHTAPPHHHRLGPPGARSGSAGDEYDVPDGRGRVERGCGDGGPRQRGRRGGRGPRVAGAIARDTPLIRRDALTTRLTLRSLGARSSGVGALLLAACGIGGESGPAAKETVPVTIRVMHRGA